MNNMKAQILSWVDGDGRENDPDHGLDYAIGQPLPSWAEPLLVERTDAPGQFEAIELTVGPRHLVLIPRSLLLEEQSRRQTTMFCITDETLSKFTRLQRCWLDARRVEEETDDSVPSLGLVINLTELSMNELFTLESFFAWLKNHAYEHEKKRYNTKQNNLSTD